MADEIVVNKKRGIPLITLGVVLLVAIAVAIFVFVVSPANARKNTERVLSEKLGLGTQYLSSLEYSQAIAEYEDALALDATNVEAYLGLIRTYTALKDYDNVERISKLAKENVSEEEFSLIREEVSKALKQKSDEEAEELRRLETERQVNETDNVVSNNEYEAFGQAKLAEAKALFEAGDYEASASKLLEIRRKTSNFVEDNGLYHVEYYYWGDETEYFDLCSKLRDIQRAKGTPDVTMTLSAPNVVGNMVSGRITYSRALTAMEEVTFMHGGSLVMNGEPVSGGSIISDYFYGYYTVEMVTWDDRSPLPRGTYDITVDQVIGELVISDTITVNI